MKTISISQARKTLPSLLDAVARGEAFVIVRDGVPAAMLAPVRAVEFPDRSELRNSLPPMNESAFQVVRDLRG